MSCDILVFLFFFFSSRRRHTRSLCDWSSDVCSSDLDSLNSMKLKYSDSVSVDLPAAQPLAHCFHMALFLEIDWLHNVT